MSKTVNKRNYVLSVSLIIISVFTFIYFYYKSSEKTLKQLAADDIDSKTEFVVSKIEMMLNSLKKTPSNLKEVLENTELEHDELIGIINSLLKSNDELYGLGTAFEKGAFKKDSIFYEPYFYKDGDSLIYTNYSTFPEYYFEKSWYKDAFDANAPTWIEPYADSTVNMTVMASYSIPFYNKETNKIKGIVVADLFLTDLQKYLSSFQILETGYITMFSHEGSIISHPNAKYIMIDSMHTLANQLNQPDLLNIEQNVKQKQSGILKVDKYFELDKTTLYYKSLESGWGIVLAFPDKELYKNLNNLKKRLIITSIILFVFIIGIAFIFYYIILSKRMAKQNESLEKMVKERTLEITEQNSQLIEKQILISERNEELQAAEEELKQNLEELQTLNDSIENQKILLSQNNQELKKYFTVIEQSHISIVITNTQGFIQYVNPYFSKITGYKNEEVIGITTKILSSDKTSREVYTNLWETIQKGKVWEGELINKKKDETEFIEKAIISPIFDQESNIISYVAMKEDITEIKLTQQKIEEQQTHLKIAYKEITDSINYAKTIQNALLTNKELIDGYLSNYFLIFKPREIVGGDFYYVNKIENNLFLAVADCTGHGVAGGFMTILGITYLHEIFKLNQTKKPNEILNILRNQIKSTFKFFTKNGLDIVLCMIDTNTNILQYSGANNPLYIVRNKELLEYKPTKNPIGFYPKEIDFENIEIQLMDNDLLYLVTDGFQDQFGGITNRKYTKKRLRNTILQISELPINEQKIAFENELLDWQQNQRQIDDITILGVRWK